ncbi:MAG: hypothetical protein A2X46_05195 [Lentisphaerae bacterium GWF2_57_35]|nr:MAG: hypothetical protein A2X46_05195 [Lentisphaerae bacterium GWF2_57_35]
MITIHKQLSVWIGPMLAGLLIIFLGIGLVASSGILAAKHLTQDGLFIFLIGGVYLLMVGWLLMECCKRWRSGSERSFIVVMVVGSLAVKIILIFSFPHYQQLADRASFHAMTQALVQDGLNGTTLGELSRAYDYGAWVSRAFPVHYVMGVVFGSSDIRNVQILNALISSLSLLVFYSILRHVAGPIARRLALVLFMSIPIQWWMVLDYTHHLYGMLYFMSGVALVFSILHRPLPLAWLLLRGACLGLILALMFLQRGIDSLFILSLFFVLGTTLLSSRRRFLLKYIVGLIVIPMLIYTPAKSMFSEWLERHDRHKLDSGLIGFAARGWSFETMGEYSSLYEQIDQATPPEQKKSVMAKMILSQLHYNPVNVVRYLLPAKIAKYFLVGYASGIEQSLNQSRYQTTGRTFKALRVMWAPCFLALCTIGVLYQFRRKFSQDRLILVSLPVLSCMIYALAGETSPRYSIYIQFCLAAFASQGLVFIVPHSKKTISRGCLIRRASLATAAAGIICIAMLLASMMLIRAYAKNEAFNDLRWTSIKSIPDAAFCLPGEGIATEHVAFERVLGICGSYTDGPAMVENSINLSPIPANSKSIAFYLWPDPIPNQDPSSYMIDVEWNGATKTSFLASDLVDIMYFQYAVDPTVSNNRLVIRLRYASESKSEGTQESFRVRWGYLFVAEAAKG